MKGLYGCVALLLFLTPAFGQVDGDYQSRQAGDWGTATTWRVYNAGAFQDLEASGAGPYQNVIPSAASGVITINGNQVTISGSVTADQVVIAGNSSSRLLVTGTLSLNNEVGDEISLPVGGGRVAQYGNFQVSTGTVIFNEGTTLSNAKSDHSNFIIGSGGVYQHNYETSAGTIYAATWEPGSELAIVGYTTYEGIGPAGLDQDFYDVRWNCPNHVGNSAFFINLNGTLANVTHDFLVEDTGDVLLSISDETPYTMEVGNDLIIASNAIVFFNYLNSAEGTVNIHGNFDWAAGGFSGLSDGAKSTFNITGDMIVRSGATLALNGGLSGTGPVILNLSGGLSIESSATLTKSGSGTADIFFVSEAPAIQTISISSPGSITNAIDFTVNPLAIVDLGTSSISGSGTFETSGEVRVGSLSSSGAVAGNIAITRVFNSGSTITYNGGGAQYMGNHHSIADVIVNNSNGVTLATNASVTGDLTLESGNLSVGVRTLTLEGNFAPNTNSLNVSSSSSLVINGIGSFGTLKTSGSTTINNLTLNRSTSGHVTLGTDLTIAGTFSQTDGDMTLSGHALTINGPYARTGGSLNVDSNSSLVIGGTGALPASLTFAGGLALNTLTLNRSGATMTTSSSLTVTNLNLYAGTFANNGTITMATGGVVTRKEASAINNALAAQTSYDVVYDIASAISSGPEIPATTNPLALRHLTKSGGGALALSKSLIINGDLTLTNGSFDAGTFPIELKGNLIAGAVSTLTSSSVTFSGTTTITGGSPVQFGDLTITGTLTAGRDIEIDGNLENNGTLNAGTFITTFGGTTAISGTSVSSFNNVLITGTLTAPAGPMRVAGNFTNNGTFGHNSGTVVFNGTTSILGTASTSFYGVSITGAFTAPSATTLNIAGDLSNTGTFTHNSGTILFNGTVAAQSLSGAFAFNNVNISNPSKVNNNGNISLRGTLSLVSSGAFDADGSSDTGILTVRSTSVNAGGRIAALGTPGNFTGKVTMERFVNGPQSWRYLSMPLTNGNVGMWQSIFPVTGNFSNPSPAGTNNVTNSTAPSIYYWNSTTQAYATVGTGGATGSTTLSNLVGYSPYTYRSGDFTISVRGNIRTGNASIPIASSGLALVPNPYPSAIDWDNVDRTGLKSGMAIRVSNGVFASYVAGGLATNAPYPGWTGEVATGQSFWIESAGATNLNLTESAKTGGQYQFLREKEPENYLRIALSSADQRDEALIWFVDGASASYDDGLDALKMRNGYFDPGEERTRYLNVSTQLSGNEADFAINAISPIACNTSLNLRVRDVEAGTHTLEFNDMQTLSLGYQVILVDHFTAQEKVVTNNFQYAFEVSADSASYADDRFTLRFLSPGSTYINSQTPPSINIESLCDRDDLSVKVQTQNDAFYQLYTEGAALGESFAGTGDFVRVDIPKERLSEGLNKFSIEVAGKKGCERFLFQDALSYDLVAIDSVIVTQEGTTLLSNIATGNQWYKDGEVIPGANDATFDVEESGDYTVEVSFGGCNAWSEKLRVEIDPLAEKFFQVYPNPTTDKFILLLPDPIQQNLKGISIHDLRGATILDGTSHPELMLAGEKVIDLTYVEKGLYMLSITTDDKTYHLKIIRK